MQGPRYGVGVKVTRKGATMIGEVVQVCPKRLHTGGSRYRLIVRWSNGHQGTVEETQVDRAERPH